MERSCSCFPAEEWKQSDFYTPSYTDFNTNFIIGPTQNSFAFAYTKRKRLADFDADSGGFSNSSIYPAHIFQNRAGIYRCHSSSTHQNFYR